MRIHSLRTRIALFFTLLILLLEGVGYVVITSVIDANALTTVRSQLTIAERIFRQVLFADSEKLQQASTIVAADFGFRAAAASGDAETVASALQNHGQRVGANLVMLVGLDGKLVADNEGTGHAGEAFPFPALISATRAPGDPSLIGIVKGQAYQLVAVPLKAPVAIGWVIMGFKIDDVLATQLGKLSGLNVTFIDERATGRWTVLATSNEQLRTTPAAVLSGSALTWNKEYASSVLTLGAGNGDTVAVLLQRSLSDAMAPYHRLHTTLLIIVLCGVVVAIVGSVFVAGGVTQSVAALTQFSRRIEAGDYAEPLRVTHSDEIGALSSAFNQMQAGIADRERRITELAYVDSLTGLPNRSKFNEQLRHALTAAQKFEQPLAVIMMDLDRFKYVNDALGHALGDTLLCEVADRLGRIVSRKADMVARLGGDEFAIMLPNANRESATAVVKRVLSALETPATIAGQWVDIDASIGLVLFPEHGADQDLLMRRADIAMYAAKRKNLGYMLYDGEHDESNANRLSLMSELRQAVERDELKLYYQPKVDLVSNSVKYVEALVRWDHPTRGFIPPDQFIPFAEQTGYIKAITRWVADKAIEQCAQWRAEGLELAVSVNVSARELIQSALPEMFASLLEKHGASPEWIWIEVTESAVMDDPDHAIETLDRLHRLGIRLSIDDFGTGYSSLTYLKRMPVDELKIDKSFVLGMVEHEDDEIIVRSTINLGHNMGLKVVAEGVEDRDTLSRLTVLGCDLVQGYHISRPLPPATLVAWLADWRAASAAAAAA